MILYLVSVPGEVKYPTRGGGGGICKLSSTPNSEINHSCVRHTMGCLEYLTKKKSCLAVLLAHMYQHPLTVGVSSRLMKSIELANMTSAEIDAKVN